MTKIIMLALVLGLAGCKSSESRAYDYMLKSSAMDKPMFHAKGTQVIITVVGSDAVPAELDIYNPSVVSDVIAGTSEGGLGYYAATFIGTTLGAWLMGTPAIAVADTNSVVVYSEAEAAKAEEVGHVK